MAAYDGTEMVGYFVGTLGSPYLFNATGYYGIYITRLVMVVAALVKGAIKTGSDLCGSGKNNFIPGVLAQIHQVPGGAWSAKEGREGRESEGGRRGGAGALQRIMCHKRVSEIINVRL